MDNILSHFVIKYNEITTTIREQKLDTHTYCGIIVINIVLIKCWEGVL